MKIISAGESNEQRDKELKLKLYSLYGVPEYWIVNWRLKTLDIYRRHDAQLQRVNTLLDGDILSSPLLPGLAIAIADIFQ